MQGLAQSFAFALRLLQSLTSGQINKAQFAQFLTILSFNINSNDSMPSGRSPVHLLLSNSSFFKSNIEQLKSLFDVIDINGNLIIDIWLFIFLNYFIFTMCYRITSFLSDSKSSRSQIQSMQIQQKHRDIQLIFACERFLCSKRYFSESGTIPWLFLVRQFKRPIV